jgi:AmiR/NasT family two-component response regulator
MNTPKRSDYDSINVSALIVSKPGEFRASLATLILSMPRVNEIHFADDRESIVTTVCEHLPGIVVIDGDYLRSDLEDTLGWVRSRARGGITIVMGEHEDMTGADEADVYLVKGIRPERLLIEIQGVLSRKHLRPTTSHQEDILCSPSDAQLPS